MLGVSDGLVGLKESFLSEFPKADYQLCFVHKQRGSSLKIRVTDRNDFLQDTKLRRKEQFPNEEALERFLVSQFEDYNHRFATRCHNGFDMARAELAEMFTTKK